jgi:hypothetical protein
MPLSSASVNHLHQPHLSTAHRCDEQTLFHRAIFSSSSVEWGLEMKRKMELLGAGILAFFAFVSAGTVIRMGYIHTLDDGSDFHHATTDVAIWSTVESDIGITAGSIATLLPLVRHCLWRMGFRKAQRVGRSRTYYASNCEQNREDRRGYWRSLIPSDLVPTEMGGTMSTCDRFVELTIWTTLTLYLQSLLQTLTRHVHRMAILYGQIRSNKNTTVRQGFNYGTASETLLLQALFSAWASSAFQTERNLK